MEITAFWDRIKDLCKKSGITQQELSKKLGYGSRNLEVKIARGSLPGIEDLKKMSEIFSVSFEYLIDGTGEPNGISRKEKFFVPVLNQKASAGYGQYLQDNPEVAGYMEVPRSLKQFGENIGAIYVEGDSMSPTLRRGDWVIADSCGYSGEGIYVLIRDGDLFVKRVYKDSGKYIIKSDNPLYPTKEEPVESDNIGIVGRVHHVLKSLD